jgi:hypothetical protein
MESRLKRPLWILPKAARTFVLSCLAVALAAAASPEGGPTDEEAAIAKNLATLLQAARTVISRDQDRINDPNVGNKGIDGKAVLTDTLKIYRERTGVDAASLDPASREGRLLRAEMDSIAEVVDQHQSTLNQPGVGFKGFIPSTFGRLITEAFGRRMSHEAVMKVTAPPELIRNRKARPDAWEAEIIRSKLRAADWPRGQSYATVTTRNGRPAFRMAVPEYYGASCLSCHGEPKGAIDLTGYPKEGAHEGDLGGVISITLYR